MATASREKRDSRSRNRYLAETSVTAVAITGGMIWRGTAAVGNASTSTTAVMVFVAAVTGMLLRTPPTWVLPSTALRYPASGTPRSSARR